MVLNNTTLEDSLLTCYNIEHTQHWSGSHEYSIYTKELTAVSTQKNYTWMYIADF